MPRKQVKVVQPGEEIQISSNKSQIEFTRELIKSFSKKRSLRDILWNYPDSVTKIVNAIQPLGAIIFFAAIGVAIFNVFTSLDLVSAFNVADKNTVVEGTVGSVNALNPLYLTNNSVDKNIRRLVFQKLISVDKDANPVPEIATSWEKSEDSKTYTFTLRDDIRFSDGVKLTAADVEFTFNTAIALAKQKNAETFGQSFLDVKVVAIDSLHVSFELPEVNSTFWEAVSVFILPKHIYDGLGLEQIERNVQVTIPIGSGPYRILDNKFNVVTLERSAYYFPQPKIQFYTIKLFSSVDELKTSYQNNQLDLITNVGSYSAHGFVTDTHFEKLSSVLQLRRKLIFINTREESLSKSALRKSLEYVTDKNKLMVDANINGVLSQGPISSTSWAFNDQIKFNEYLPETAAIWLGDLGYVKSEESGYYQDEEGKILSFTLTFLDNEVNKHIAENLAKLWDKEGIILSLIPQDYDQLTKETIATRNFQLLLFEIETTVDPDQYNLWHSLKVDYPNLNLSGYKYSRVDVLLERSRKQVDLQKRKTDYLAFQKYLLADDPVIFLYQPNFDVYVSRKLNGVTLDGMMTATDLYNNVSEWSFK